MPSKILSSSLGRLRNFGSEDLAMNYKVIYIIFSCMNFIMYSIYWTELLISLIHTVLLRNFTILRGSSVYTKAQLYFPGHKPDFHLF